VSVFEKGVVTILGCAVLMALIAIPLALRKVPRNLLYGFRTRATLGDDATWYAANAHFGRGLLIASLFTAVGIVILYGAGLEPAVFLKVSVGVMVAPLAVAILSTFRFIRSLKAGEPNEK
jgi:SdpI/YhfL family protein